MRSLRATQLCTRSSRYFFFFFFLSICSSEDSNTFSVIQDIFSNGNEDQRRAMMKSFQESGGTVLSTNWDEVGKGPVKGSAPPGQEMKKWDDD